MKKIQILVVEDNRLLREGITALLKKQSDMHVIATIGNGEKILDIMAKHKSDIILLDLGLRNHDSLRIVKLTKQHFAETKVIVMDLVPLQADILEFIKAGVSGFMLKDASVNEFYKTIRSVYQGTQVLPPHLTGSLFSQIIENAIISSKPSDIVESVHLSKREQQVIALLSGGLTNKEIAKKLHLSSFTVKSHVHNILEKLALNSRVQIAVSARFSDSYKNAINNTSLIDG